MLLGKLATHEFAHGGPSFDLPWPPARNPWNLEHFTGGSSSGSGAAVAAGLAAFALGSDTGGSIRGPSSHCGLAGLMPTYGLVSRAGVIPNSYTFDHCGPMAWTVEDCAIVLQALAGHDPADAGSVGSADTGLPQGADERCPGPEDRRAAALSGRRISPRTRNCAGRWMRRSRCSASSARRVEDVPHAPDEGVHGRQGHHRRDRDLLHQSPRPRAAAPATSGVISWGASCPRACSRRRTTSRRAASTAASSRKGARSTASTTCCSPPASAPRRASTRTAPSASGSARACSRRRTSPRGPALEICNGFSKTGLPLGMQIIGRPFDEATVLQGRPCLRAGDGVARSPAAAQGGHAAARGEPEGQRAGRIGGERRNARSRARSRRARRAQAERARAGDPAGMRAVRARDGEPHAQGPRAVRGAGTDLPVSSVAGGRKNPFCPEPSTPPHLLRRHPSYG